MKYLSYEVQALLNQLGPKITDLVGRVLKEQLSKPSNNQVLTNEEFIELMHISKRTAQNWRAYGILTYYKVGGNIYYRREDIETLFNESKVESHVNF